MSVADLRWNGDFVLVDIDAAPSDAGSRAKPDEIRFGVYGTLAHPVEATGLGSCDSVQGVTSTPLSASAQRLTGTVCVGPVKEHSAVRVDASLCTQVDINDALLYATVSVIGTHAAVWATRD